MRGLVRRIAMPAVIAAVAFGGLVGVGSSASAEDGIRPGLPVVPCPEKAPVPDYYDNGGRTPESESLACPNWFGAAQIGLTGSVKAQQWTQIPLTMTAVNAAYWNQTWSRRNTQPGDKIDFEFAYDGSAFFVSPSGSSDEYGDSAPITVKTLAFGAIPAEVTLQVTQQRDADGLPVPLKLRLHDFRTKSADNKITNIVNVAKVQLRAPVDIRVRSIKVDGVDVGLGDECRTGSDALVKADAPELSVPVPKNYDGGGEYFEAVAFNPLESFYGIAGGTLTGSVDIPGFAGCGTATGDDMSPLLTSALSADNNPLSIRLGTIGCFSTNSDFVQLPPAPGINNPADPDAGCAPASIVESYKINGKIKTVPLPFDLPNKPVRPVTNEE